MHISFALNYFLPECKIRKSNMGRRYMSNKNTTAIAEYQDHSEIIPELDFQGIHNTLW
jgi:hypothetical protein